jgi:hypothetical protein
MVDPIFAYYRLTRIDDGSLPANLEYHDGRCVITDGDLVLRRDTAGGGDGVICIRWFGRIFGLTEVQVIALERQPFDRIDQVHLTFPGGFQHRRGLPPDSVVRYTDDGLELELLASVSAERLADRAFGRHRWSFVASEQLLPDSDAAAG